VGFYFFIAFYVHLLQIKGFVYCSKAGCNDRQHLYYRAGDKIIYGSENSKAITFRPLGKVVKRWSNGRMKKVILWEVDCLRERI
jgi:hypothetical protein